MWSVLLLVSILPTCFATAGHGPQTDGAARARRPGRARDEAAAQGPTLPARAVLHDESDNDEPFIAKGWPDVTGMHAASALARPAVNSAIGRPMMDSELDVGSHPFGCDGICTTGGTGIGRDSSTLDTIPSLGMGVGAGTGCRSW